MAAVCHVTHMMCRHGNKGILSKIMVTLKKKKKKKKTHNGGSARIYTTFTCEGVNLLSSKNVGFLFLCPWEYGPTYEI